MREVNDRIPALIMKYLKGELSDVERKELGEWIDRSELNQTLFDELTNQEKVKSKLQQFQSIDKDELWKKTLKMIDLEESEPEEVNIGRPVLWRRIAVAASVLILFSITLYFSLRKNGDDTYNQMLRSEVVHDLSPGSDKAFLTLADGTVLWLDSIKGEIALMSGMKVRKTADGQIIYDVSLSNPESGANEKLSKYNQISTPRGGQYQIVLSDGTKVWLNSSSSLKYPIHFNEDTRSVELSGEAYFEVNTQKGAQGKSVPFIVKTPKQTIEVLGTQFNVSSYEDEESVKTTLLEGKVSVAINSDGFEEPDMLQRASDPIILRPNEQSILNKNGLNVIEVNAEESIAWKNGYFSFQEADLKAVMQQLSRWYDVDIVYAGRVPDGTFTGKIHRNMSISKVFEVLDFVGVDFKIERTDKYTLTIY